MTDLATRGDTLPTYQTPLGLLLSIGDTETRTVERGGKSVDVTFPIRLDHFRAKPGALDQYHDAAAKFTDVYGTEPRRINDVYFMADTPKDVLDIRLMAFSTSGLRLRGDTNYGAIGDPDEFREHAYRYDDTCTFYPRTDQEVPAAQRDTWHGEPITGNKLGGPDDPRIGKYEIRLVCSLSFLLPEILGVGTRVMLTTGGRRSTRNLHAGVWSQYLAFRGLLGRPFRLSVRPARTQRFDVEKRAMVSTTFYELVLDTPQTVLEIMADIRKSRATLGPAPAAGALPTPVADAEAQVLAAALELPTVDVTVFDEVEDLTTEGEVVAESGGGGRDTVAPTLFGGPTPEQVAKREENIRRRMETGE